MNDTTTRRGGRLAVMTAVAGTVLIAAGAFWLSFTALADLARRSGIAAGQAWAWPLIVDGIIVVATVAVVALAGSRVAWYPWMLLICGAGLSVTANSIHAIVAADADVPAVLAACVAAVPPLVLLAITHLTVILTRRQPHEDTTAAREDAAELHTKVTDAPAAPVAVASLEPALRAPVLISSPEPERDDLAPPEPGEVTGRGTWSGREVAEVLRAGGWSNKKIARYLDVHPSTVGRWFPQTTTPPPEPEAEQPAEAGDDPEDAPVEPAAAVPENEEEPS
ncbi:DUF2637 domain-containing protein [Leucobacter ruminantium]|uniref:DUF2637 domain-containing protein n=1 Tax=Leucobacter ruminantium TaxID=1289170 RepID=A0A939LWE0_9MICO|nr:DUF2637 domain-containing protein [Leucobacter ruminantium]MBO1806039.1 DUF2637 domain-containing protein [Leucobacter ruminantium]